jgi:molybdopterin converting factor small subunit
MITINIFLFSTIRAIIGEKRLVIDLPEGSTIWDLKLEIGKLYPQSEDAIKTMLTSVDKVFCHDDRILENDSEVAFFPFVSGG